MTGLSAQGNYLYLGSTNQNRAYRYTLPNITSITSSTYFFTYSDTRDIAKLDDGSVYVASDRPDEPVRGYNETGTVINSFDSTFISSARGMAVDTDGYIWVSNMETDEIYKVDVTQGIEGDTPESNVVLSVSANPFQASVVITAQGFSGSSSISIYDINGHVVAQDGFEGTYIWNDETAPSGAYFAVVSDTQGNTASVQMVRL